MEADGGTSRWRDSGLIPPAKSTGKSPEEIRSLGAQGNHATEGLQGTSKANGELADGMKVSRSKDAVQNPFNSFGVAGRLNEDRFTGTSVRAH